MRRCWRLAVSAAAAAVALADASSVSSVSVGTLVRCPRDAECLWLGVDGREVRGAELRRSLAPDDEDAAHRLQRRMAHIEQTQRLAQRVGHAFPFRMGVHVRHLAQASDELQPPPPPPELFVAREAAHWRSRTAVRRLAETNVTASATANGNATLNWCTTENPLGRSVCSTVKSQENCGSCWAFAASDAIETAVAIASNQSAAVALAPQQFLACSKRETEQTFSYCWLAGAGNNPSWAPWLGETMRWKSVNNGCSGGMTHGAFMDAAQQHYGLVAELDLPYNDKAANASATAVCVHKSNRLSSASSSGSSSSSSQSVAAAVASISDWKQVVGRDCSASHDANVLLKLALQSQPIAVAISSAYPFTDYKGGFYSCPNGGDLASKNDVNHALVLVGHGTDAALGDYWILKNSYGHGWGDGGYMKLLADNKTNCGLNVFPVAPIGAKAGAAPPSVDGGGEKRFVGLSPGAWIAVASSATVLTLLLTAAGAFWSNKRRAAIRAQTSGDVAAQYVAYNE